MPRSILKWAGGKTSILHLIEQRLNKIENKEQRVFYDVFTGGGSVAFEFQHLFRKTIMNDVNKELINVYRTVKTNSTGVYNQLLIMKEKHNHDYYYDVRNWDRRADYYQISDVDRAARTIYLNKTCYNGLYRVNRNGKFNVPLGRQEKVSIVDKDIFDVIHRKLTMVELHNEDFDRITRKCAPGDVVYIDPPYDKINGSSFVSYNSKSFSEFDQKRLSDEIKRLTDEGIYVIASNSLTPITQELYGQYLSDDSIIKVRRSIASVSESREPINEILIDNIRQVNARAVTNHESKPE